MLTIAIPTYNREKELQECLESIRPQLRPGVEVVISNNGSTDGTAGYLESVDFARVHHFSENRGIDHNIVKVFEMAKGDYVFFFSDDDLMLDGTIDHILGTIEECSPALICLNHFPFRANGWTKDSYLPKKEITFSDGGAFFRYCGLGHLSSLIVKKSLAEPFVKTVVYGKECAHLDLVARVALTSDGPFVYLGKVDVAGRSLKQPRYIPMRSSVIYQGELWKRLFDEGLIDKRFLKWGLRRLITKDLFKLAIKARRIKKFKPELDNVFSDDPLYNLVKPLYLLG